MESLFTLQTEMNFYLQKAKKIVDLALQAPVDAFQLVNSLEKDSFAVVHLRERGCTLLGRLLELFQLLENTAAIENYPTSSVNACPRVDEEIKACEVNTNSHACWSL